MARRRRLTAAAFLEVVEDGILQHLVLHPTHYPLPTRQLGETDEGARLAREAADAVAHVPARQHVPARVGAAGVVGALGRLLGSGVALAGEGVVWKIGSASCRGRV